MAQRTKSGDFYWFFGVVENRMDDPLQLGRVKVRILNYHSPFDTDIATENLPWASVVMPNTEASSSGIGSSPCALVDGTWIFGFFKDGKHAQQPVILGSIPGFNKILQEENKQHDPTQDNSSGSFGGQLLKYFGDGFRDRRGDKDLQKYPRRILSAKLPEGCTVEGNDHGIQFTEDTAKKYPLEEYKNKPDTHILALNDKIRLKYTLEKLRRLARSKGGFWDDGFFIRGSIMNENFKCGVTNESGISRAKHVKPVLSTAKDFTIDNYRPFKENPPALTDGGIRIYNPKNIINK